MRRALTVIAACLALAACGDGDESSDPRTVVEVGGASVTAEVADDVPSRQRGLSGRDRLAPDAGMLFLEPNDSPQFWMKGMRFPIDIVWIRNGRVVDVTADVPPPAGDNAPLPTYSPERPANRVLEVNAGWAEDHGVERGDPVRVRETRASG